MITAEGYTPLITQLYFTGDPYISTDPNSSSPLAKKRIRSTNCIRRKEKVLYDVSMAEKLNVEPPSLDGWVGFYTCLDDNSITCDFFKRNGALWYNAVYGKKLDPFGRDLKYIGANTFQTPSMPAAASNIFACEINESGKVHCTQTFINSNGNKFVLPFSKEK